MKTAHWTQRTHLFRVDEFICSYCGSIYKKPIEFVHPADPKWRNQNMTHPGSMRQKDYLPLWKMIDKIQVKR